MPTLVAGTYEGGYSVTIQGVNLDLLPDETILCFDEFHAIHNDLVRLFFLVSKSPLSAVFELRSQFTWNESLFFSVFATPFSTPRSILDINII